MILCEASRLPAILITNSIKKKKSQKVILLGLKIDKSLIFKDHVDTACLNASYKLHALGRTRKYLTPHKAKPLYDAFINI